MQANAQSSELVTQNEQLLAQKQELERELASLERIGYDLGHSTNLADALSITITDSKSLLQADTVVIYAYNERQGQFLRPAYTIGLAYPERFEARDPLPRAEGLTAQMVRRGSAILTQILDSGEICYSEIPFANGFDLNAQREFAFGDQDILFLQEQHIRSSVGLPLRAGNDLLGVLYVSYRRHHTFTPDELRTLGRLAQHAALAIQRANTYKEIAVLHEAGEVLIGQTEMKTVLQKLFEYGRSVLGAEPIILFPYHATTEEFELPPVVLGELYAPEEIGKHGIRPDDIAFKIIQHDQAYFAREVEADDLLAGPDPARRATRFVGREHILSSAAVPLRAEGETVGVLFFDYRVRQRFGSHQRQLIETFAHYAAAAIQRAQLATQRARLLSRREDELQALADINQAITGSSLPEVLNKIISSACQIVEAKFGSIMLVDESGDSIYLASEHVEKWTTDAPKKFKVGEMGVTGWVARHKRPARIGDVHAPEWQGIYVEMVPSVQSELAVPILDEQGVLVGIINLESRTPNAFSADDERLLVALSKPAYIAIRNQRLFNAEQHARRAAERLTMHLQAAAEIARDTTAVSHLTDLLSHVTNLVKSRFGFYHVGIYLVDEQREYAILWATTPETGSLLLEKRHQLRVGQEGIVGHVIRTGQPHIAPEVEADPYYYRGLPETHSEMTLPLKLGAQAIGALDIQSREVNAFAEDDIAMLKIVSDQLAVAIENARLLEAEQHTEQVRQILSEVDHLIINQSLAPQAEQADPLEKVLQLILDQGLAAVDAPTGHIALYDKAHGDLYMAVCSFPEQKGLRQKLTQGIIGKAARERQTQRIADVTVPPWNVTFLPAIPDTRSELAVPLLRGERLVGVFNAESPKLGAFGSSDQALLEGLARQAAAAYETAERYQALQTLRELNQLLTSTQEPDEFIKLLLRHACILLHAEWGNLRLYNPSGQPTLDYSVVRSTLESKLAIEVVDWRWVSPEAWVTEGIVARVAREREPYLSKGDVQTDPTFRNISGLDIHSEMAASLLVGDELVGVLNLESERVDAFDMEDLERLLDFAVSAAVAVRDARGMEDRRQARERFQALNEVGGKIINAPLDEAAILTIVLEAGLERTGAFHAVAWQLDEGGKQLDVWLVRPIEQSHLTRQPIPLGETVEDQVALNGQVAIERREILIDDVDHLPAGFKHRATETDHKSMLVVPLVVSDAYYGNIDFRHKEAGGFKVEEIELIKGLVAQAANAIRRVRSEKEKEKIRQSEREVQTMAEIGLEAGELAHKINNWFGLAETQIEAIKAEIGREHTVANKYLDSISGDVKLMLSLVRRLREESVSDPSVEKPTTIYTADYLLATAKKFHPVPPNVRIEINLPASPLHVRARESILDAFGNLLVNAGEALETQGGVIRLSAREIEGWIEFQIADNGPGIEAGKREKIFRLFYTTKRSKDNLGFGLWSVRRRVLASGGTLSVKSEVGQGTTFFIRLPRVASDQASLSLANFTDALASRSSDQISDQPGSSEKPDPIAEKSPRQPLQLSEKLLSARGRVLIVDDFPTWRDTLSDSLHTEGWQVDTAASLGEAIQCLETCMYHMVITDLRLEDSNTGDFEGITLLDELSRRYGETNAITKIVISGHATREQMHQQMRQAFTKHEVFDFLTKDAFGNGKEFLAVVRRAFEQEVRMNPGLEIVLEEGLTFEEMVVGLARDGQRVKRDDPDFARLVVELDDLFRRLFYDQTQIVIGRVTSGHGKSKVVKVQPFSRDANDESVIVKFGDWLEIDREHTNYEAHVKGKIGTRATSVLNRRRTPLLGGIVYSLIGTRLEQVVDFADFYRRYPADEINTLLDDLFHGTCQNWYANKGARQHSPLTKLYSTALDFGPEQMLEAFKIDFECYLDQPMLSFSELPGERFPNPAYASLGKTLARSTYLCTTHGDLNANNVLIDEDRHTWLIDFYRTGKGHILRDCVQLETVIKFVLLEEEDLPERFNLEKALAGMRRFKEADRLRYKAPTEAYAKVFKACRKLRQLAGDLVRPNDDFSEYEIGLLYCSLNTQRFYALPKVNRQHALLAAGMLCQKLGLSPK